ncbi:RecX family transcriptional regulator [Deinococcus sp.]|uniref:RecX family transcriptional regulator n=1 Tax=Deinococcus sp. TaxID=47478 RepID=UPI00286992D4|nr:RecX family transcriptional regulator [Deinococcus sp.]
MRRSRPATPASGQPTEKRPPQSPQEARDALLAYAFRALGGRALTGAELREKLEARSDDPELVQVVLTRVQELGYQDDAHVARAEGRRANVGRHRVRQILKRRGVPEALIQETVEARDPETEAASALALLERRWPSLARKRYPKASAYAFLARRGFPGDAIWPAIRTVLEAQDGTEEGLEDADLDENEE